MDDAARRKHSQDSKETLVNVILSNVFSLLKIVLICFVLVYFVFNYGVRPIRMDGGSMFPTLTDHDYAFTNAFAGNFLDINRGDIVVAYDDKHLHTYIIKRVIALPGETISAKDEMVYIDGSALDEPYLDNDFANDIIDTKEAFTEDFDEITLKDDEYFLMGDNRIISVDSRELGPFERSDIKGQNVFVFLPFGNIGVAE